MAAPTVDVGYLAASYSVPDTTLQALLTAPTIDLVQSLLRQIEAKARSYDDLQSDKLRADVELEAAVQGGEQRARSLKTAADKAQKEADELRLRLAQEETARQQVETKLRNLEATATSSTSEVQTLEARIKTLEAQNRDAIAMHEAKVAEHDRLATELSEQHRKSVDLRKQLSALEEANHTLESAATSVRFRETNLQQEIEQLRTNNEWYTTELKTRSSDHAKYRKEKNAQIAQLQREAAEAADTTDSLRRTETLLRQHVDEIKAKAEDDCRHIEELEGSAAKIESDFRIELDSARRLATLHQQTGDSAKKRLQELQAENERFQNEAATEVGQLQSDIEMERNKANEAEGRIAELETLVENLQGEAADLRASVRVPGTPRHGMNGAFGTPGRAASPGVFSPGGSQMRGGSSAQTLKENIDLKNEVRKLRLKVEEQSTMLQEMIEELERRQPEFEDLRRGNEALTAQNTELANFFEDAIKEREAARKDARKALGDLEGLHNQCSILRHETQDMTIQLRSLMWRREAEQNGLDSLPAEQKQFILNSVNNQVPDEHLQNDSATQDHITKHLVLYKDIADLQYQNSELLRTIRKVGETHEAEEARSSAHQQKKDFEELTQLRSSVAEKEEEIQSLKLRSKTFKSERDMYYRMTVGRQTQHEATSAFAQSLPAGAALQLEGAPQRVVPEYDTLIKDLQAHINLLKDESTSNSTASKTQIDGLTKDNTQLQSERLRLESQVRREQDRYSRLEATIKLLQSEKDTLQDRYNHAQANYAQRDDRAVKAEQELADSVSRLQGLESEMVNLRATQNMSKTIEARLNERVKELIDERDRLNKMVAEIQSLRNEQELTNADHRRRLQASHDKLEAELQIARRKLEDEVADHRKTAGQRDYERMDAQRRIDDLVTARNNAEVKSATADSNRQQLEQRIKDLQTQLQSAEERVQSLQPRPTPRANGSGSEDDESISREEELTTQLSDLQRKMQLKQEEVEEANANLKGFQDIAQDAEDRLQSFVEAHERLQTEIDLAQQEKDATINDLQQRVDEISSELATTTTELTELRGSHEQELLQLTQQKDSLEAEITRLNNDVLDYKAEAVAQSELVKTQADIATRAQKDYEHELAKHGETMKKYRLLYDEHSKIQTEIAQSNSQAEAARNILEQSQEHWKTTQGQFESQLEEAKRRHDDLKQYNATLLRQFDDYKAQIDNLKNDRATTASGEAAGEESGSRNIQDIEVYLRREKEILEVQFNLKEQEVKRLEQQVTHFQHQLDQTRERLIAEQSKGAGLTSGSTLQNLQDKVEQLNLFRESNTTLRSDNGRLQTQVAEKTKQLEDLRNQLEPLQERVTELEGELELSTGHLKAVEEDRDRWQKRHQDVLQRYDRIDPKELEDLKQQIDDFKAERDQALEEVNALKEKIEAAEAARESIIDETREATILSIRKEETDKARQGFNRVHNEKMAQKKAEIDALVAARDELQNQLTSAQQEYEESQKRLGTTQEELSQAQQQVAVFQQQVEQSQTELTAVQQELAVAKTTNTGVSASTAVDVHMSEDGQVDEGTATSDQLQKLQKELDESQKRVIEAQGRANAADGKAGGLAVQLSLMKDMVSGLDKEVAEKGNRILELQNQLSQGLTQSAQPLASSSTDSSSEEIQKLKDELATARQTIEDLRAQLDAANSAKQPAEEAATANVPAPDEQTASIKAELDQREAELNKLETNLNTKSQKVLEKANKRVKEIREETNKEIDRLKTAHQTEIERLQQEQQPADASSTAPTQQASQAAAEPMVPVPEDMINTQTLARPSITVAQFRDWLNEDPAVKRVFSTQVRKHVDMKDKEYGGVITKLNQEIEELKTNKSTVTDATADPVSDQPKIEQLEHELAQAKADNEKAKADNEKNLKEALEKEKQGWIQRGKDEEGKRFNVKMSMANRKTEMANDKFEVVNVKWLYVQKAAKETPEQQVDFVYEQADQQKPPPKPAAQPTPAKPQAPAAAQQQPASFQTSLPTPLQTQQNPAIPSAASQANGTNGPFGMQSSQPALGQQSNPFVQNQQGGAPNPFVQAQNQMGRGIPQPGFTVQVQNPQMFQQQQHGRGRGDGVGTGPQALRGVLSQSNLRGGASSIPMPGGRGRGQQQQSQQQQQQPGQQQLPGGNAPTQTGVSQIGRGGNRAAGRGRGLGVNVQGQAGGAPGQGSPRGGMNPGAVNFQPGGGRGQKRNADDDAEGGGTRGGKRQQRGGRGGQGGGAGGAPAASGE